MKPRPPKPTGREWLLLIALLLYLAIPVIAGAQEGEWFFVALFGLCIVAACAGFWTARFR